MTIRDEEGRLYSIDDIVARHWSATEAGHQGKLVQELEELFHEHFGQETNARAAVAYLRNQRATVNTTDACDGDWDRCWCDDCEKRRLLKRSGKPFTNYEVFSLTLEQVKEYVAAPERSAHR